jgi:hypothetical protein
LLLNWHLLLDRLLEWLLNRLLNRDLLRHLLLNWSYRSGLRNRLDEGNIRSLRLRHRLALARHHCTNCVTI